MATKRKAATRADGKSRYIVNRRMASRNGGEVWSRGAEIWLDDLASQRHLAKGNILVPNDTTPPAATTPTVVIHEAAEEVSGGATDDSAKS